MYIAREIPEFLSDIANRSFDEESDLEDESTKDSCKINKDESSSESKSGKETIISQYVYYEDEHYTFKQNLEDVESNVTFKIEYLVKNKNTARKKNGEDNCKNEEECGSISPRPTDATMQKRIFTIERFFVS